MDNKQLIHMACEGLVIGGVVLYFSKQMKTMSKEIEDLKAIIAKNQAANEKRFEVIFNFLDNVNGGFMQPQQPPQPRPQPQREGKKTPQTKEKVKAVTFKEEPQEPLEPRPLPSKKKAHEVASHEPRKKEVASREPLEQIKEMQEECDPETEVCDNDVTDIDAEINMLNDGGNEDIEESVEDDLDE